MSHAAEPKQSARHRQGAGSPQVLWIAFLAALSMLAVGCGGSSSDEPEATSTSAEPTPSAAESDPVARPSVDGLFEVDRQRRLRMVCWGEGSPTVVLEAGHPDGAGVADYGGTEFVRLLAEKTQVCAYDRAGWGESDPAPREPRSADDVVRDLRSLLTEADVPPPYVLVGSSFGGMIVSYYADQHPESVAGVALLDVPAPSARLSEKQIPEIAWDHPSNAEHVAVAPEFENRFAERPVSFPAPLVVVTATGGQSSVEDQQVWLRASPDSRQVELDGGHEIYLDDPEGVAAEVVALVDGARG